MLLRFNFSLCPVSSPWIFFSSLLSETQGTVHTQFDLVPPYPKFDPRIRYAIALLFFLVSGVIFFLYLTWLKHGPVFTVHAVQPRAALPQVWTKDKVPYIIAILPFLCPALSFSCISFVINSGQSSHAVRSRAVLYKQGLAQIGKK